MIVAHLMAAAHSFEKPYQAQSLEELVQPTDQNLDSQIRTKIQPTITYH